MNKILGITMIAAVATAGSAGSASAQYANNGSNNLSIEARGIAAVPTFDIANAADVGFGFGAGVGYRIGPKIRLMADFDLAMHGTPTPNLNINTYHFMGKVGFDVFDNGTVSIAVNAGAGIVQFGGDLPATYTYPAINAGAKIAIKVSPMVSFLISPQGDIAFSDVAEVGTDNSWVWPFGVGLRVSY